MFFTKMTFFDVPKGLEASKTQNWPPRPTPPYSTPFWAILCGFWSILGSKTTLFSKKTLGGTLEVKNLKLGGNWGQTTRGPFLKSYTWALK